MKVRIGRRRSNADVRHSRAHTPESLAVAPAFSEGRWDVPDHFNFARDVVEVLARNPKRRALTFLSHDGVIEPRTFHQLVEGAARWTALLRERGLSPGDRMLVVVGASPDWIEIMLAGLKIGAVSVPCGETLSTEALEVRIASAGAKLVVASRSNEGRLALVRPEPEVVYTDEHRGRGSDPVPHAPTEDTASRDIAFILSTSGTARGPLGVAHTHGSTFAARVQTEHWLDAGPGDAVWCTADTGNALAVWNVLVGPWSRGAEVIVHHGAFEPRERLDLIDRLGTTILCQSPSEYAALTELREFRRYRPRRLRRLVSTGDTLEREVIATYEEAWGMTIHEGYGQAETAVVVANGIDAGFRPGSVGLPIVGQEIAVVDDQGTVLEPGVEGELALRGRPPSLFSHYWDAPEQTKAAFRGDWYVTGDVATTDEDGFVWLSGRAEDVITSRGRRFGPFDIERTLREHRAVSAAAAVGVRDLERGGQFVRAFVVLAAGAASSEQLEAELRDFAAASLPEYEVPREVEFVDELPQTLSGNVRRTELRDRQVVGRPLWESPEVVEPEPVVFVAPEPEPEAVAPEPEPTAYAEPEPVVLAEPEPVVLAEPEPAAFVEPDAIPTPEPEPVVEPEPAPVELEPVAYVEPEPEPVDLVEPEPVALTEPEPAPQDQLDVEVVEPVAVADPEPAPTPAAADPAGPAPAEPEGLPDYVIVPGTERPRVSEPPAPSIPVPEAHVPEVHAPEIHAPEPEPAAPEPDVPDVAMLGLPPVTFQLDRAETSEPATPKRSRSKDEKPATRDDKRGLSRSTGEPGDETEEVTWMEGLSTRLSAYSLAQEDDPGAPAPPEADDADDDRSGEERPTGSA